MKVTIVGCGKLGSILAYVIAMNSYNNKILNDLILIDNDILEEKNLPYLFIGKENSDEFVSLPKVDALSYQIRNISDLKIETFYNNYEDIKLDNKRNIIIDCRDKFNEDNIFKIKLCCDGEYGRVILNPKNNSNVKTYFNSTYILSHNNLLTTKFCVHICENYIFNRTLLHKKKRSEYIIELKGVIQNYERLSSKSNRKLL